MTQFDTEINTHIEESQPITTEVQHDMDDHEMLLHHVTQHDHELYALDCALCDILGV
ncbi:MAG: hypothetical protein SNH79_04725 [Rikenellaceae bacterium]